MFSNFIYNVQLKFELVPRWIKVLAFSLLILIIIVPGVLTSYFNLSFRVDTKSVAPYISKTQDQYTQDLIVESQELIDSGRHAEAFKNLVTSKNNFSSQYDQTGMARINAKVESLTSYAKDIKISSLYEEKDLTHLDEIFRFTGYVISINTDDLYGTTYTISDTEKQSKDQLEVYGLNSVSVGSKVTFYGVPEFTSVTSPIKVEGY